jgi:hypothetical protein
MRKTLGLAAVVVSIATAVYAEEKPVVVTPGVVILHLAPHVQQKQEKTIPLRECTEAEQSYARQWGHKPENCKPR